MVVSGLCFESHASVLACRQDGLGPRSRPLFPLMKHCCETLPVAALTSAPKRLSWPASPPSGFALRIQAAEDSRSHGLRSLT